MKLIKQIKENKDIVILIGIVLIPVILMSFFVSHIIISKENRDLKKQIEFYETSYIREAEVIQVEPDTVHVNDNSLGIISLDINPDLIHTTIKVGDTAVYLIQYDCTSAELLTIIKRGV